MKILLSLIILMFTTTMYSAKLTSNVKSSKMKVTFVDVGQGDAEIIQDLKTNKTIVVDTGVSSSGIVEYLKSQKIKTIDLLILTHPHSDHIGATTKIMDNFKVKRIMDPGFTHASKTYLKILQKIKETKTPYTKGMIGQVIKLGDAKIELMAPPRVHITGTRSDANTNSIIFMLTLDNFKTYFAADSEHETEEFILKNHKGLKADVLKVAHHGSKHATSADFLDAVKPEVAVISAGLNNSYNHPAKEVTDKLKARKIKEYITFRDGTVIVDTDGNNYSVKTVKTGNNKAHNSRKHIKNEDPDNYKDVVSKKKGKANKAELNSKGKAIIKEGHFYASKSSKKFYAWNCKGIKRVKPSNLLEFSSFEEVVATNRTLASRCKYDSSKEVKKAIKKEANSVNTTQNTDKETKKNSASSAGKININTATVKQLSTLKGIGKKTAERIINHRNSSKFKTIDDIKKVKGIGKGKFNKIKDFITAN